MQKVLVILLILTFIIPVKGYDISGSYTNTSNIKISYANKYEGKFVIIEFFSTGCSACKDFHPKLTELYNEHGDEATFVSVTRNSISELEKYVETYPMQWDHGTDDGTLWGSTNIEYTPTTILFNPLGVALQKYVGQNVKENISNAIERFVVNGEKINGTDPDVISDQPTESIFGKFISNPIVKLLISMSIILIIYFKSNKTKSK